LTDEDHEIQRPLISEVKLLASLLGKKCLFGWLVADGWCWFVLREKYCWLVAAGWFVLRDKYY
jgi:hypothetical protein